MLSSCGLTPPPRPRSSSPAKPPPAEKPKPPALSPPPHPPKPKKPPAHKRKSFESSSRSSWDEAFPRGHAKEVKGK